MAKVKKPATPAPKKAKAAAAPVSKEKSPSTKKYVAHALAETVPGCMTPDEQQALQDDIKVHGIRHPIVLFQGKIIDGRARYAAAQALELKNVPTVTLAGDTLECEVRELVISYNLHRRTLNTLQKACVAATIYGDATGPERPSYKVLAKRFGISEMSLSLCLKALASKNAMLITRLRRGEVTRGELEEEFYDRSAAHAPSATGTGVEGEVGDIFGVAPPADNVVNFPKGGKDGPLVPAVGKRNTHPERRSKETPASVAAQTVKGLTDNERTAFVQLAWAWLERPVLAYMATLKAKGSSAASTTPATAAKRKAKAA